MLAAFGIPILMMVASQKHQCNGIRLCILYTITINIYIYIYIYICMESKAGNVNPIVRLR